MSSVPAEYRSWLAKAEEDRLCIRNELSASHTPWAIVAFHAQQAAEKTLKALIVYHGRRPRQTHDLGEILNACLDHDASLVGLRDACDRLSYFAVDARYPDLNREVAEDLARLAVEHCERICAAVRAKLPAADQRGPQDGVVSR